MRAAYPHRHDIMIDFVVVVQQCAPNVHVKTIAALVRQESGYNPYAIGVVGKGLRLARQPRNKEEALVTARSLIAAGLDFSVGIGQIFSKNLPKYGLTLETAFDVCSNLRAADAILVECYDRAKVRFADEQSRIRAALSCYYSGNFVTGHKEGYVRSVAANSQHAVGTIRYIGAPLQAAVRK